MFTRLPALENLRALTNSVLLAPARVVALDAPAPSARALVMRALAQTALRGASIGVVLGDNHFDAYALARFAQSAQIAPATFLARIELSRAFTCYQLHQRVVTLDETHLQHWRALFLTGFLDTFYDESVAHAEAARLVVETLTHLKTLAARGLPILVTLAPAKRQSRAGLTPLVAQNVDAYWRIEPPVVVTQTEMTFAS